MLYRFDLLLIKAGNKENIGFTLELNIQSKWSIQKMGGIPKEIGGIRA